MGYAAMMTGSFNLTALTTGSIAILGMSLPSYYVSFIGGALIATVFMLGAIAIQHPFNACLGPNWTQDRMLTLAAECGFLSMIVAAIMSMALIPMGAALISLFVAVIGWYYTYAESTSNFPGVTPLHGWIQSPFPMWRDSQCTSRFFPHIGLVADPIIGVITTAGESLAPVIEKVAELEAIADDIVNMLSGKGNFLASFPGRDRNLPVAGGMTAFWYGLAVGLFIAGIYVFHLI